MMIPTSPVLEAFPPLPTLVHESGATSIKRLSAPPELKATNVGPESVAIANSWITEYRSRVAKLTSLADGWDGPNSRAPSRTLLYVAEHYLWLALAGVSQPKLPFVVPGADGSVQLEWHEPHGELEVAFSPDSRISAYFADEHGNEVDEEGAAAINLLVRRAPRLATARSNVANVSATSAPNVFALSA